MTSSEWEEKWGSQAEANAKDPVQYDSKGHITHTPEWVYDRMF